MGEWPDTDGVIDVEGLAEPDLSAPAEGAVAELVDELLADVDDLVAHLMHSVRRGVPERYRGRLGDDDWDGVAAEFIPAVLRCVRAGGPLAATEVAMLRARSQQRYRRGFPLLMSLLVIRAGVAAFGGYVVRKAGVRRLSTAVVVLGRLAVLSHDASTAASAGYGPGPEGPSRAPAPGMELAPVPHRILELAALGRPTRDIARELHYSEQAVTYHLSRLMKQFQAPNRTALIAMAVQRGVVALPEQRDADEMLPDGRATRHEGAEAAARRPLGSR